MNSSVSSENDLSFGHCNNDDNIGNNDDNIGNNDGNSDDNNIPTSIAAATELQNFNIILGNLVPSIALTYLLLVIEYYSDCILIIVLLLRFGHYVRMPAGGDELLDTPCSVRSGNSVPANKKTAFPAEKGLKSETLRNCAAEFAKLLTFIWRVCHCSMVAFREWCCALARLKHILNM